MNRRGFLQGILAAGVAPAVVGSGILMPVRSILLPTFKETIELGGNRLLTIDMITKEALAILHKNMTFVHEINRTFDEAFLK